MRKSGTCYPPMPELPEVEILARHLAPLIKNRAIHAVEVRRAKVIAPTPKSRLERTLRGATFQELTRRGKYLLFRLRRPEGGEAIHLVGHLGMTGRMYLQPSGAPLARHTAVRLDLGGHDFIFEDTRYFGRFTLDTKAIAGLGPEPLSDHFTPEGFAAAVKRSAQAIKVKLLDQALVAGVGNIYASEALFRARISPRVAAQRLTEAQSRRLWQAIREVLADAIEQGSTIPLDFAGSARRDGLFYYGSESAGSDFYQERLLVYDRLGSPCTECGAPIRRVVQAARSTYYCGRCQRA